MEQYEHHSFLIPNHKTIWWLLSHKLSRRDLFNDHFCGCFIMDSFCFILNFFQDDRFLFLGLIFINRFLLFSSVWGNLFWLIFRCLAIFLWVFLRRPYFFYFLFICLIFFFIRWIFIAVFRYFCFCFVQLFLSLFYAFICSSMFIVWLYLGIDFVIWLIGRNYWQTDTNNLQFCVKLCLCALLFNLVRQFYLQVVRFGNLEDQ